MRRQNGFTLIELMTAVGLTGLLLSMAVPAMGVFVANARQTGAINDLVASIHLARSTAIKTNVRVTLCPSAGGTDCETVEWKQGWIAFADLDSDQTVDVGETIFDSSGPVAELDIDSSEFGQFLMYRPNGRVMTTTINGNSGQFTVCNDRGANHAKVMIIQLSGRPQLSDKQADGSTPSCS